MSIKRSFRLLKSKTASLLTLAIILLIAAAVISSVQPKPRVRSVAETPIAFWAWRNQVPAEADVREAIDKTHSRTIFLHAGQIDIQDGAVRRIRPVNGSLPQSVDLHLVYNATRSLLAQLDRVDESDLASTIGAAFKTDSARAEREGARVVGVQIDIDVPTGLLNRYTNILKALRTQLTPGTQLSITGLPTWMQSSELRTTLDAVDFWIPQFYGAEIPDRSDQLIPISSPANVARFVQQARAFDKPFYAGLSAYSYTLLYNSSGSLITLRGDMDPARLAADQNLELIEQRPFAAAANPGDRTSSEWRYLFRARGDGVTDELAVHAGDLLLVDIPSSDSLRLAARTVREWAGEKLLGICVFRLPAADDPATLTIAPVAAALADLDSRPDVAVRIIAAAQASDQAMPGVPLASAQYVLEVANMGTASAIVGTVNIDLEITAGMIDHLEGHGLDSVETLCPLAVATTPTKLQPCSQRRATVLRFKPRALFAGQTLTAHLVVNPGSAQVIPVSIEMQTDNGTSYFVRHEVAIESGSKK